MTRSELQHKMAVLLGGRAAEMLIFGELSTGAADDLAKATDIARNMVMRYGMNEQLGQMTYEDEPSPFLRGPTGQAVEARHYSEETGREIDCAVRKLVDAAYQQALEILKRHRASLEEGAKRLLEKETLNRDELPALEPIEAERQAAS